MRNYNTVPNKRKVPVILVIVAMVAFTAAVRIVANMITPELTPDIVHPMTNASVSWDQTFYSGAWGDGQ